MREKMEHQIEYIREKHHLEVEQIVEGICSVSAYYKQLEEDKHLSQEKINQLKKRLERFQVIPPKENWPHYMYSLLNDFLMRRISYLFFHEQTKKLMEYEDFFLLNNETCLHYLCLATKFLQINHYDNQENKYFCLLKRNYHKESFYLNLYYELNCNPIRETWYFTKVVNERVNKNHQTSFSRGYLELCLARMSLIEEEPLSCERHLFIARELFREDGENTENEWTKELSLLFGLNQEKRHFYHLGLQTDNLATSFQKELMLICKEIYFSSMEKVKSDFQSFFVHYESTPQLFSQEILITCVMLAKMFEVTIVMNQIKEWIRKKKTFFYFQEDQEIFLLILSASSEELYRTKNKINLYFSHQIHSLYLKRLFQQILWSTYFDRKEHFFEKALFWTFKKSQYKDIIWYNREACAARGNHRGDTYRDKTIDIGISKKEI
jgi:hypothetical protein